MCCSGGAFGSGELGTLDSELEPECRRSALGTRHELFGVSCAAVNIVISGVGTNADCISWEPVAESEGTVEANVMTATGATAALIVAERKGTEVRARAREDLACLLINSSGSSNMYPGALGS